MRGLQNAYVYIFESNKKISSVIHYTYVFDVIKIHFKILFLP